MIFDTHTQTYHPTNIHHIKPTYPHPIPISQYSAQPVIVESMLEPVDLNPIQKLIHKVGGEGKYQFLMFLSFGLKWFMAASFFFSLNFLFLTTDFVCQEGESGRESCQKYVCSNPDPMFWRDHLEYIPETLSYAFQFYICNKSWIVSTVQSFTYWGSLLGYILFSHIADNYGRRKAEILSWGSACVGLVILCCSFNIYCVSIGLFLGGMGMNSAITLHYTFIKEFVIGRWRERMIISLQVMFSLGVMWIGFISMYIKHWRYLTLFTLTIPTLLIYITSFFLEQTPEFLLNQSQDKLRASLNRIARINTRSELEPQQISETLIPYTSLKKTLTMWSLFSFKSIRLISYACGIINIANQFIYDATIFNFGRIGLNVYINQIVTGFTEIWAAVYGSFIVPRIKRKIYSFFALIVCGACTFALIFVGYSEDIQSTTLGYIQLSILVCMRFVLSSFWGIFFVYVGQLFPYNITSIAYAYVSTIGTLGASASPYIKQASKSASMIIMTVIAVVSALHVLLLPETKGVSIPLEIEEGSEGESVTEGNIKESMISST